VLFRSAAAAVAVFAWAARSGQFDDLTTPPLRIFHEDDGRVEDDGWHEGRREGRGLHEGDAETAAL